MVCIVPVWMRDVYLFRCVSSRTPVIAQVVMEDQLLRASKLPPRPGSMTDIVRRALSRVYYSYKPQVRDSLQRRACS